MNRPAAVAAVVLKYNPRDNIFIDFVSVWINTFIGGIMFLRESKQINRFTKKSKFGKLSDYSRTKTLTHWQCDHCGIEFTKVRNGKYNPEARSYCKPCITKFGVNKLAGQAGYESKIKNNLEPRIGDVILDKSGYPEIYIGKNYPYRKGGYRSIRLHQYNMEMFLERGLLKHEVVHHIDGNKMNNDIENLYLTTIQEHNKLHACSENLIFELYKRGLVVFNKSIGRYELKEGTI